MADRLQAVLSCQLGEEVAGRVYARLIEAALHLQEALAAETPPGLEEGAGSDPGELLAARLRNASRAQALRRRLLADSVTGRELARALEITPQAVDQARRGGKVVALRSQGTWRYPLWQFDFSAPDPLLPHLAELAQAGGGLRLALVRWLPEPDEVLGTTPLEALRGEAWRQVVERARQLFLTVT